MATLSPISGPAFPELGWVPAPAYILRRRAVLDILETMPRGPLLEIGCASGALLLDLDALGFECWGVDRSTSALALATRVTRGSLGQRLACELDPSWKDRFNYLVALEVLEHIADDRGALAEWRQYLCAGGHLLLSVPAHPQRWDASDVYAGHFRRYTRAQIEILLASVGLHLEFIYSYGFPVRNIIDRVRAPLFRRRVEWGDHRGLDRQQATDVSGIDRRTHVRLFGLYDNPFMRPFWELAFLAQRCFFKTELGTGYIVLARLDESV